MIKSFPVSGGGTFSFHTNAVMASGSSSLDGFTAATMVAVFYPT